MSDLFAMALIDDPRLMRMLDGATADQGCPNHIEWLGEDGDDDINGSLGRHNRPTGGRDGPDESGTNNETGPTKGLCHEEGPKQSRVDPVCGADESPSEIDGPSGQRH